MADRPLGTRYLLGDRLGRGATGQVLRARRRSDGAELAVKLLREDWAEDDEVVARFLAEKRILTALDDPHVVRVLDLVVDDGDVGIVMELVPGGDLRRVLRGRRPPPAEVLAVGHQVARALTAAHAAGVVHGDVKPENVLLGGPLPDGPVKLGDFGIARMVGTTATRSSGLAGTPTYMAPESVSDGRAGPAADVYALGILLYETLAGRPPFGGASPMAVWHAHTHDAPARPDGLGDAWWALLGRMLAKEAADRPTAADVVALLPPGAAEPDVRLLPGAALAPSAPPIAGGPVLATPIAGRPDGAEDAGAPDALYDQETLLRTEGTPTLPEPSAAVRSRRVPLVAAAVVALVALVATAAWAGGAFRPSGGSVVATSAPPTRTATPGATAAPSTTAATPPASRTTGTSPVAPTSAATGVVVVPASTTRPAQRTTVVVTKAVPGTTTSRTRTTTTVDTTAACQDASRTGQLVIGSNGQNAGGPNTVPSPCTAIWLVLTEVHYITHAQACLDATGRCGPVVYLLDAGRWNRLLDGVSPGDRWTLKLTADGPGTVGFRFSG